MAGTLTKFASRLWSFLGDTANTLIAAQMLVDQDGTPLASAGALAVKGALVNALTTLTRPATTTAYSVGDLIANSETAGSVAAVAVYLGVTQALIRGLDMSSSNTSFPAGVTIRWHLFDTMPTLGTGDNGAAFPTAAGAGQITSAGKHLGYIDVTPDVWLANKAVGHGVPCRPLRPTTSTSRARMASRPRSTWCRKFAPPSPPPRARC